MADIYHCLSLTLFSVVDVHLAVYIFRVILLPGFALHVFDRREVSFVTPAIIVASSCEHISRRKRTRFFNSYIRATKLPNLYFFSMLISNGRHIRDCFLYGFFEEMVDVYERRVRFYGFGGKLAECGGKVFLRSAYNLKNFSPR